MTTRNLGIDALRSFSILLVVFSHYGWLDNFFLSGTHGVAIFFMVSGYCIRYSMSNRNGMQFLTARFWRLVPILFVCATLTALVEAFAPQIHPERGQGVKDYLLNIFCLPLGNLLCDAGYGLIRGQLISFSFVDGAYWSLLVEIRFYLLLCVFAYGFRIKSLPLAVAAFGLISIFNFPLSIFFKGQDFLIYLPFFAFGLAYREWVEGDSNAAYLLFLSFGIFSIQCLLGTNGLSMGLNRGNFASYSVCFLIFIFVMSYWRNAVNPVITYLGVISYPLYLIHQDVGYILISIFSFLTTRNFAVILTLTVVVTIASLIDYFTSRGVKRVRFLGSRIFDRVVASGK